MSEMAKKVSATLIDDVDGEATADDSVEFGIDGITYEIDLASRNLEKPRTQLSFWRCRSRYAWRAGVRSVITRSVKIVQHRGGTFTHGPKRSSETDLAMSTIRDPTGTAPAPLS